MDGLKPSQVQPSRYVFLETKEVKASEQFIGFWIQVQIFEENSHWACVKVANAVEFVCACHQNASSYDGQRPEKYLRIWNNLALQGIFVFAVHNR